MFEGSMELGLLEAARLNSAAEPEFEAVEYPPRLPASVAWKEEAPAEETEPRLPLDRHTFDSFFDQDGRLVDEHLLRQAVFKGGISEDTRADIWRFLFEFYPFNTTKREREVILSELHAKYIALKMRWKDMMQSEYDQNESLLSPSYLSEIPEITEDVKSPPTPSAEVQQMWMCIQLQAKVFAGRQPTERESLLKSIRVIDKDVPRTDRKLDYFKGANPHLRKLRDVLVTYAVFHPEVGYAQGMNDIVSRFLVVLDSEVEAYWCFANYMEHVKSDFIEDGVLNKLLSVGKLLHELDTDLQSYLEMLGVGDLTFCHRWMLLSFKREFPHAEALRCYEILSSHHLELSSAEAHMSREEERRKSFAQTGGTTRLEESPLTGNTEFTFDVFMCVAILIHSRKEIFMCQDPSEVFQLVSSLSKDMCLDTVLLRSERLFHQYCRKSVVDCFHVVELPSPTTEQPATAQKPHKATK